jgi:cobalt-zinc-cadmium efflux system membrane fusion protein
MAPGANSATILVVDDDAAVRQVLGRVLAREGHTILEAGNPGQALRLAAEHPPQLALLDLCLGDGDATELADRLHARQASLPLILITGFPLRLHENPGLSRPFLRVLTKPVDVNELRRAVTAALTEGAMQTNPTARPEISEALPQPNGHTVDAAAHAAVQQARQQGRGARIMSTAVVIGGLVVLAGFLAFVIGVPIPGLSAAAHEQFVQKPAPPKIELVTGTGELKHTVLVPEDVRTALGIRKGGADQVATVEPPRESRPLVLSGSTALDPTRLMRIRARFAPAEVMEIGQVDESTGEGPTKTRELRSGDRVKKGDLLGIFYSVDVGNKKNDLVDAVVQLKLDQELLAASQRAYDKGALPGLDLIAAKRNVEGDYNDIGRAENTLRAWNVPEEDIEAVRKEAEEINRQGGKRDRDPEHVREQLRRWARVELRAPDDGTIVERNVTLHETVVDNTINLFQIARVNRLLVIANAPEDELPKLQALSTEQRRWTVHTVGAPKEGIPGTIDDISYLIDVNQHSAVVKGHIPNPKGELRSGQFVTATVELPPPEGVVVVPMSAIADDGKQAVVFVQAKDRPGVYTMRRVEITQRFDKTAFVRSKFDGGKDQLPQTAEEKEQGLLPRQALKPGERVITSGVLELKKELEDRESSAGPNS